APFVHLHVHSQYSLLDGACHLERLVRKAAQEFRMPALALTDHGNLFGAIDFYTQAQKEGLKPIVGCELYVAPGTRFEKTNVDGSYEGANHLTVLVKDQAGYKNLIKLVTAGFLEGFYYKPRVDRELLQQHAKGLLVLSGCLNGEVCRFLMEGQEAKAKETAAWYRDVFGPENYFMELQWHGIPEQKTVNEGVIRIARSLGVPLVATNDVHYLSETDFRAHEILLCIQTGKTTHDKDRMRFSVNEFYLKSPEQMAEIFRDYPEALKNTVSVAERCNLELEFGKIHLPHYQAPAGQTLDSYLEDMAWKGLRARFPEAAPQQEERLKAELGVIQRMGYAGYFLIVWDFIRFAKERGISVGPGRGSAAGSLVAYALGITNIDPLRYGLLFERFLNPERVSMPDMDIDFSYERRDEVINYVTEKYGKDNVAQIITFGTLGAKAVIRDVARALGLPYSEADKLAKMVPTTLNITLDDALAQSPALAEAVRTRPEVAELWQVARALEGLTRHASTHAAGVVISRDPLTEHVPLYRGGKGEITTQYAMGAIEKIGLLKMDFLGLRTLTVISNTLELVRQGYGTTVDIEAIPPDDEKTFRLLEEARTNGVFQLESTGMRDLLRRLRPGRLEDVIALVALYRPGPMVMIDDFIARRHGRVKVTYDHPALEEILKDTYGVMVYQEQVMRIAGDLAGFSMGEADILRRAMGKKDPELMEKARKKFLDGARTKNIPARTAEKIFDLMAQFAGYGFNKCLTADSLVEMADGTRKPMTAVGAGETVLTKDGPARTEGVRPSGQRAVRRLTFANGMSLRCTPDHPLLTQRGWVNAEEVTPQDFVAVVRQLPCGASCVPGHFPALLGYALSEGALNYGRHFYLYSSDDAELADMAAVLSAFENTVPRLDDHRPKRLGASLFPKRRDISRPSAAVRFLFEECGLQGKGALEKFIPALVDAWDEAAISVLVAKMLQGDGCIHPPTRSVFYATSSERLARDFQRLLMKLGFTSTIRMKYFRYRGTLRPGYTVHLLGGRTAFQELRKRVGLHMVGARREALWRLAEASAALPPYLARGTLDIVPATLALEPLRKGIGARFGSLKAGCRALGLAYRLVFADAAKKGIRRDTLLDVAERLGDQRLHDLAIAPLAWTRLVGRAPDGEEETYDISVPGPSSFIANGVVVHNSHAAAYAVVAYETAYLKAHYPVEFMAALLTSEMADTDKIVKYIEECRAMGITVLPPDVNESDSGFKVVGDKIRFGLVAVKNVGDLAIHSILESRKAKGKFTSLYDFCQRVDLRLVNKRVLESLIKCGAFDSLGARRPQLMATVDAAMEAASSAQRDRAQGQVSLLEVFEAAGAPAVAAPGLPEVPEWSRAELLAAERETLGFYITGHPLAEYDAVTRRLNAIRIDALPGLKDKQTVRVCGIVSAVKEISTKNGDRMAFVTVEDQTGSVETVAFPDLYRAKMLHLVKDAAVLVTGQVDITEDAAKLLLSDVEPLDKFRGKAPQAVRLTVGGPAATPDALRRLRELVAQHPGSAPLTLALEVPGGPALLEADPGCGVAAGDAFVAAAEALLGRGSVLLLY
ncbi:MAG TPA: DNA polymerase III subunit alpha, partial [Candidatus Methylomirabilis sp.]|nr:DNA polymerase III subunit alpha [Candidatus Methylomirabilis sp.]